MTVGEKKLIDAEVVDTHPHHEPIWRTYWPRFRRPADQFVAGSAKTRREARAWLVERIPRRQPDDRPGDYEAGTRRMVVADKAWAREPRRPRAWISRPR